MEFPDGAGQVYRELVSVLRTLMERMSKRNCKTYTRICHTQPIWHYVNFLFLKPPSPFPNIWLMILEPLRLAIDRNSKNLSDVTQQAKD